MLLERLRAIRIETPVPDHKDTQDDSRSGQNSRSLGPILLGIVQTLNAVECLPDLLRLEQDLHELIAKAETDAAVALPDLILDSPSVMLAVMHDEQSPSSDSSDGKGKARSTQDPTSPEAEQKRKRATALITCKIYQRELLGLMKTLLQYEDYAPIKSSSFVKAQQSEGRRQLLEAAAAVKSPDDLWYGIRPLITWDAAAGKAHANEGAVMQVRLPYTPAVRNEIRSLTEAFLKEVPPEKPKAGTAFGL